MPGRLTSLAPLWQAVLSLLWTSVQAFFVAVHLSSMTAAESGPSLNNPTHPALPHTPHLLCCNQVGVGDGVKYVTALYWSISTVATVGFGGFSFNMCEGRRLHLLHASTPATLFSLLA